GGAVAGPGGDRDLVAGRQRVFHAGAELVLPDRLAGIERERAVARRAAVVPHLRGGQPLRIVGGEVETVEQQGVAPALAESTAQQGLPAGAVRRAVVAVAVAVDVDQVEQQIALRAGPPLFRAPRGVERKR